MSTKMKDKNIYIEQLRILAIFAVVAIHCYGNYFNNSSIYGTRTWWAANLLNSLSRWSVPMFFMISGMLLLGSKKQESILEFMKKKMSKVLLPFFVWSVVYYVARGLVGDGIVSVGDFFQKLFQQNISYHLWFVYTLLNIYLLVPILKKMVAACQTKDIGYLWGILFLTTTMRPFINKFFGLYTSAFFPLFDGYLGWFIFGYVINQIDFKKGWRILFYLLGMGGVIMSLWGSYAFSSQEQIDTFFNLGFQLNSYLVASALFLFFKYEMRRVNELAAIKKVSITLGKYVYGVYLVHALILGLLKRYMPFNKPYQDILYNWGLTLIISFILIAILDMSMILMKRLGKQWVSKQTKARSSSM